MMVLVLLLVLMLGLVLVLVVVMMLVLAMVMVLVMVLVLAMVSSPKEEGRWPAVAIACCIAAACNKKIFNFFPTFHKLLNSSKCIFRLHIYIACVFVCIPILLSA